MRLSGVTILKVWGVFLVVGIFVLIRLANSGARLSDTGIYIWTADQMLSGKLLYRDIFFTNLPLFPVWSAGYVNILRSNVEGFFLTAMVESMIAALLVAVVVYRKTKNYWAMLGSLATYLISAWSLNVSAAQNGVFVATICGLIAYIWFEKKKNPIGVGVFVGLMLLFKAYFLPIAAGIGIGYLWRKRVTEAIFYAAATGITILLTILPFVSTAGNEMKDAFLKYSLIRPDMYRWNVVQYTFITDPLFVGLLIFGLANWAKQKNLAIICGVFVVYAFLYRDFRYLYLQIIIPYLAICAGIAVQQIWEKRKMMGMIAAAVLFLTAGRNVHWYATNLWNFEKIPMLSELVSVIKTEKPKYLYGNDQLVPILSYLSRVPVLRGVGDTNENMYRVGILDKVEMSKAATQAETLFISYGVYYPQQKIEVDYSADVFEPSIYKEKCSLLKKYEVFAQLGINALTVSRCGY